ncbi:putative homeodomain-interacting protein kinase 2-like [Scophthalmus maximus]|uniref:Putative homeodomain-interacting protein kinase 2-like n=1 Tax=Scophthalmus maximus TaxID=52904 RepID=A0A2U9C2W6_SCOMX|nr:homeodomain-interacting protein kinase 2-like [Scophthalmus maximus]AWP09362.1 putative homeodomain-interacting protein kinase 2-like [Scophthalmus maximus]
MSMEEGSETLLVKMWDILQGTSRREDSLLYRSREKHSYSDRPNRHNSPGPSAVTAPPTVEVAGTAASLTDGNANTNLSPAVCGAGKADTPTDEAAAYVTPSDGVLQSETTSYNIMGFIGEGGFGKVAKCVDLTTGEVVAIKIHKENGDEEIIQRELAILEKVRVLDPDQHNIVKFIENFQFGELPCLAFEMLDMSLTDLIKERESAEFSLNEIRPVTQQLLVAFEALKNIGVIHMDLKPENIMFVNHKDQPFKIKLIDFGLALSVGHVEDDDATGTFAYGAPEVFLGLPLTEAVDMWAVGCVMAFMYFGMDVFPFDCPYDWMNTLVHLLGYPHSSQINAGMHSLIFFILDEKENWRLRTPDEFEEETGIMPTVSESFFNMFCNLEDAVKRFPEKKDNLEFEDRMAFLDLLKGCLHLSAEQRICASEALCHHFITMAHLVDGMKTNSYADTAHRALAAVRPFDASDVKADGSRRKKAFRSARKFFGRVKKQVVSIFTRGKNKRALPKRKKRTELSQFLRHIQSDEHNEALQSCPPHPASLASTP